MPLYDATLPLSERTPAFPGDPRFEMIPLCLLERGDSFSLAALHLTTHSGTHIDPPAHYLPGSATIERISPEILIGPGSILDMRGLSVIDRAALERAWPDGAERILLKTDNGNRLFDSEFREDYVHLTVSAAEFLVERGVKLVGIDYLSVDAADSSDAPVHRTLLAGGVVIVEGLVLSHIPPGACRVYCLPLLIEHGDGAPTRVIVER
jgi:arylformamidase